MNNKKIKILTLSDHPLTPSGVGTQTRYIIEGMLRTGKYQFISFGGLIKHEDYRPIKTEEFGDDWIIIPTDGYGTPESVRSIIRTEKPDLLWFMTDPRFFGWLWEMEDEIRPLIPMVYYHVWDNYPYPDFNKVWYESTDVVVAISKLTHDIVQHVAPNVEAHYLPHAVNPQFYKPLEQGEINELRSKFDISPDQFVVMWNNRNARRKQPATLLHWFKEFLDQVGHENAKLIMHTDPKDPNGPNLVANIQNLGLTNGQVQFSTQKVDFPQLASMYNIADVTVNISDAEGFGLATLESLSCATPIIVNMTGGLQEQVTNGDDWFGVGLEPSAKSVIGSQDIPYIYEDRVNKEDFIAALTKLYNLSKEERREIGMKGKAHVDENYSFEKYTHSWDKLLKEVHKKYGSWENRKGYTNWSLLEV